MLREIGIKSDADKLYNYWGKPLMQQHVQADDGDQHPLNDVPKYVESTEEERKNAVTQSLKAWLTSQCYSISKL